MKLVLVKMNGDEIIINCNSFEFRTNQVSNWIRVKYADGHKEMYRQIAVIKNYKEN